MHRIDRIRTAGRDRGSTSTEYALVAAFIALAFVVGAILFGQKLGDSTTSLPRRWRRTCRSRPRARSTRGGPGGRTPGPAALPALERGRASADTRNRLSTGRDEPT